IDPETSSGYFLSLDLMKGVAQLRAWGENPGGITENAYRFEPLQAAFWQSCSEGPWRLMATGLRNYLEIAVDDRVLLTLSDETYCDGRIGFYVESACLKIDDVLLEQMQSP